MQPKNQALGRAKVARRVLDGALEDRRASRANRRQARVVCAGDLDQRVLVLSADAGARIAHAQHRQRSSSEHHAQPAFQRTATRVARELGPASVSVEELDAGHLEHFIDRDGPESKAGERLSADPTKARVELPVSRCIPLEATSREVYVHRMQVRELVRCLALPHVSRDEAYPRVRRQSDVGQGLAPGAQEAPKRPF